MTDNDIIKALECCGCDNYQCDNCPYAYKTCTVYKDSLDLIKCLQSENEDLFYKLTGVMHSVDKWLDGDELKQDEVNRAATMREKTLQIVENLQSENERLEKETKDKERAYNDEFCLRKEWKTKCQELLEEKQTARSEAYKEFAERLKNEINIRTTYSREQDKNVMRMIDNLIKEMVGEEE